MCKALQFCCPFSGANKLGLQDQALFTIHGLRICGMSRIVCAKTPETGQTGSKRGQTPYELTMTTAKQSHKAEIPFFSSYPFNHEYIDSRTPLLVQEQDRVILS